VNQTASCGIKQQEQRCYRLHLQSFVSAFRKT